ncbi:glutathione synthase [Minwuia thermotolerans]|uniref:Glutathione synthetase n=1 Tax=Minwuia thermotolerans TaxID=2056226 RepID=A0A2M9FY69_9PROT|nr:glutathione synthase [Minwuia thermotolerans]PJK28403.1 glutathione synthase [Minwuia thermotolerans]
MSLKVAVQMDPIAAIDINADSTFALMLEASARGHRLHYYLPQELAWTGGQVKARLREVEVRREKGNHFTLGEDRIADLTEMDVVLLRQDPPYDMAYLTTTYLLERIHPKTLVVNDPTEVRNAPEKLFVTEFVDLMPATLITRDTAMIRAFYHQHGDIIVKPLYGNGGAGVFYLRDGDHNLSSLLEMFQQMFREPLIAQKFLPAVREGDKRIILVDGEPAGAINRVPAEGESRSNMHVGGTPLKSTLTEREHEICARIGPELKARGMIFVGIDVIGGLMTEINVTSPTGIQEIDRYDGANLSGLIWDAIEAKR